MNRVILCGRLTRDPNIIRTDAQLAVARFTLAVDRRVKKDAEQTADFPGCVAFGKTAEFAEKYLHKGTKVIVEGRLQTGSYTNKDGQKVYTTDVVVDTCEFAESKRTAEANGVQTAQPGLQTDSDGFMEIPPDADGSELPFN